MSIRNSVVVVSAVLLLAVAAAGCSSGGGSSNSDAGTCSSLVGCSSKGGSASSGGGSSGGGNTSTECAPQTSDTACGAVLKTSCCDQLVACNADTACVNCVQNGCSSLDTATQNFFVCFCGQSICNQAVPGVCPVGTGGSGSSSSSGGSTGTGTCGAPPNGCFTDPPAGAVTCSSASQPCPHDCGDNFQFPAGFSCAVAPVGGGLYCCNK